MEIAQEPVSRRTNVLGTVYLICFRKKLSHAKHYLGWTEGAVEIRLSKHKDGTGSCLLRAANKAGIAYRIVRVWENVDRNFERKLKNQKNNRNLCPCCGRRKRRVSGKAA